MAVYTTKGSSPWGTIGALAGIAGMATGNPWLTAIGAGANMMNGGSGGGALAQALGAAGCWPGGEWTNPASGSMVTGYDADTAIWQDVLKKKQAQNGGLPAWLQ